MNRLAASLLSLLAVACVEEQSGLPPDQPPVITPVPKTNAMPVADAGPDLLLMPGADVRLDGRGSSDPDGDALTYEWAFDGKPFDSAAELLDADTPRAHFGADVAGRYVVGLTVSDGRVRSVPDFVTIDVASIPLADAGPDQKVAVGTVAIMDGSNSRDPDGGFIRPTWTLRASPAGSTADVMTIASGEVTLIPDVAGTYEIELVVHNGAFESAPDTVIVEASNRPIADAGAHPGVTPGTTVRLDGSGSSDPDGDPLAFAWTLRSAPAGSAAVLSDDRIATPTFVADLEGPYLVELVVNDGTVDSARDSLTVWVSRRPIADAGPDKTWLLGARVTVDGGASYDENGRALTYLWSLTPPAGSALTFTSTEAAPSFVPDAGGDYALMLVVSNGIVDSLPDQVEVSAVVAGPPTALVPDSGQTNCYDEAGQLIACAGTGQDGERFINPMSYTPHPINGTVTDDVTGLTWHHCALGQSSATLCSGQPTMFNWYEATGTPDPIYNPTGIDACGDSNRAGRTDWRLPTAQELQTLVNYGRVEPAIRIVQFQNVADPLGSYHWTASDLVFAPTDAWAVEFQFGGLPFRDKDLPARVRCVRGNRTVVGLADAGDGTVVDLTTGLTWQQIREPNVTWQEALDYCNTLTLAGRTDWRVPTVKELVSLVDYSASPALDAAYFETLVFSVSWSSTSVQLAGAGAWIVELGTGVVTEAARADAYDARCVR